MIPFINQAGAVFKKWITVEKGAKIAGGLTIQATEENGSAMIADGDCEINGNISSVHRLSCKQIMAGEIQAKELMLGGQPLHLRMRTLEDDLRTNHSRGDQERESLQKLIASTKTHFDVEFGKFATQLGADRTTGQDARRSLMAQADKDRGENFSAHESIIAKINDERVTSEKMREDMLDRLQKTKEENGAEHTEIQSLVTTNHAINEDAHKLILEKLTRYRTNTNATHEEFESRLGQLEGVLSSPDPDHTDGLVMAPSGAGQSIDFGVRNGDNIVKRMMHIDGSPDGFGQVTIASRLLLKDPSVITAEGRGGDKGKDVLSTLQRLERHLLLIDGSGQTHTDTLHATAPGHKIGLSVSVQQGEELRALPVVIADYDTASARPLLGVGTMEPKAELHVVGEARLDGDTQVGKNLFVVGDAKHRGNVHLSRNLYLAGDAKLKGTLQTQKNLYVQGDAKLSGLLSVQNSIEASGDCRFDNDVHVKGNILTYNESGQESVPLQQRLRELETEVAYLKKALMDLKKDEKCEGSIRQVVRAYVDQHDQESRLPVTP